MKFTHILLSLVFSSVAAAALAQAERPFVIAANGNKIAVERIESKGKGNLVVYLNNRPQALAPGQYIVARGVRPPELARASSLMAQGKTGDARTLLEGVMKSSAYQTWDVNAASMLIEVYASRNDSRSAAKVMGTIKGRYPEQSRKFIPDLQLLDWKVRAASPDEKEAVEREISEAVSGQNQGLASRALLMRGDLKAASHELRAAQLDYLRAAHFYGNDPDVAPQALFRVADTFNKLDETQNALQYLNELKQKYPNSELAARGFGN